MQTWKTLNLSVMREFCNWSRHDKSLCNLADLVWSTSVLCGSVYNNIDGAVNRCIMAPRVR